MSCDAGSRVTIADSRLTNNRAYDGGAIFAAFPKVYATVFSGFYIPFMLLAIGVVKIYDAVVAMTQGGPGQASEVPAKFIMDHLFARANIGLASAASTVMLLTVIATAASAPHR